MLTNNKMKMALKEDEKGLFMILPVDIHTKLKSVASVRKRTMTAMFIEWVESLEVDPDET